jgi:molybdate transport system ATP-binding protein
MLSVAVKKSFYDRREVEFRLVVSFAVGNGFTVLTGSSGAGKTTLLRLIAGILTPDEGRIEIGGRTLFDSERRIDVSIRERNVGFVFQDYALFPHLTAAENVAYGIKAKDRKYGKEKAFEMLRLFHIEHTAKRIPREMSGGEQQRAALARALASDPSIVLLDEPLSAVDVETRTRLFEEIENAQSRAGIPFIYVTHNQSEAERFGKQRLVLENGEIVR